MSCPPNNALQRTRLRAPLSFETFGDTRKMRGAGRATTRVAARTRIVHPVRPDRHRQRSHRRNTRPFRLNGFRKTQVPTR